MRWQVGEDLAPPVDAQLLDHEPEERFRLLRLGLGDDAFEFVGDGGEFGRRGRLSRGLGCQESQPLCDPGRSSQVVQMSAGGHRGAPAWARPEVITSWP